ncbi:MAG: S8 family peptidase [Sterolibacterium sp.]
MAKNNLLLGNGQALVAPTDWPSGGRSKPDVYSLAETRAHLHPQLELFSQSAARIPPEAAPRGEVVGKVLVHPEYLAKSHFPAGVLRMANLRHVGSRSRTVQPRRRLRKRDEDSPMFTAELLVAGSAADFRLLDQLLMQSQAKGIQRDLSRIEEIGLMAASDRVRAITRLSDGTVLLEAVLHAEEDDDDIFSAFAMWAKRCDGRADLDRLITVDGLSFLPVHIPFGGVESLARFSHLRVLRSVQPLRSHEGALRSSGSGVGPSLPLEGAMTGDFRVAVFDGGMDATGVATLATEHVWPETKNTTTDYLDHGAVVTSALLFGPVSGGQTVLPRPYAAVDHYRVATPYDETVPEMFDTVERICEVLDRKQHAFVNISLAPPDPVDDDDVHLWTSVLEHRLADGRVLAAVAVGNHGARPYPGNRIQVPSDLVNALAVGSADAHSGAVVRAAHSCVGRGRSPGLVKPDGLAWGGTDVAPLPLYDPRTNKIVFATGTSFATPLALRTAVGACALADGMRSAVARALLIHTADRPRKAALEEVGHGRFSLDPFDLLSCGDREAMVVYEGQLEPSKPIGARLPWPGGVVAGKVTLRATLLFFTPVDLAHPINYTRAGIEARLRRSPGGDTVSFFSKSKLFGNSEQQMRADAHKWETLVTKEIGMNANTLDGPTLELIYRARNEGMPVSNARLDPLPYVLVVTVTAKAEADFYNRVRQRYPVLTPVKLRVGVSLPTRS